MIKSFRHKGLKRLYADDDARGVDRQDSDRIRDRLALLQAATSPEDVGLPQYRLHQLKGDRAGTWAITVRANWRMTFRFEDGHVVDLDLEDYH